MKARTQNNLGSALQTLGERESGTARLEEAVAAFRDALQELTRAHVPLDWARTEYNLALVYRALYDKDHQLRHLDDALEAADGALEEFRKAKADLRYEAVCTAAINHAIACKSPATLWDDEGQLYTWRRGSSCATIRPSLMTGRLARP